MFWNGTKVDFQKKIESVLKSSKKPLMDPPGTGYSCFWGDQKFLISCSSKEVGGYDWYFLDFVAEVAAGKNIPYIRALLWTTDSGPDKGGNLIPQKHYVLGKYFGLFVINLSFSKIIQALDTLGK